MSERNFYNMDDDYIDNKYVLAEEKRQKEEAEQKRLREEAERSAFIEAEKQRKMAEQERLRRKDEEDRLNKLEEAKQRREEEDRLRKEKEKEYKDRLDQIEKELKDIEDKKRRFVGDRNDLITGHGDEHGKLRAELEVILESKREIENKERLARAQLQAFEGRAKGEMAALDSEANNATARQSALAAERREVQNEMLEFLKNPQAFIKTTPIVPEPSSAPKSMVPNPAFYNAPPVNQAPPQNPYPGYMQQPGHMPHPHPGQQPQPMPQPQVNFNPQPISPNSFYANPGPTPSYPNQQQTQPSAPPATQKPAPSSSGGGIEDQIKMLDGLLKDGVMNQEEYEANRNEALKAAGINPSTYVKPTKTGNSEVDQQIAQLDQFLREGVLQKEDYEDAKKRVLDDANKSGSGAPTGNSAPDLPMAAVAGGNRTMLLAVTVPANKRPGDNMMISYNGREYNVQVPNGMRTGQQFHASVPV